MAVGISVQEHAVNAAAMAESRRRPVRIALLWHSAASRNLGIGALTLANMAIVKDVAHSLGIEPVFRVIGSRESGKSYIQDENVEIFGVSFKTLLSPGGYWKVIGNEDVIVDIGAGDSFAEIYGPKRFLFLWLTKLIASLRRKPIILAPQTIGPFTRQPYKWLAAMALRRATFVVARDEMSLGALRELEPNVKAALSADVAFALPYEDKRNLRNSARLRIGVNVSGLLYNEADSSRNSFGLSINYARVMRNFINAVARRPDVEVHLISHAAHKSDGWDDDGRVADMLAAEIPGVVRAPDFAGPCEAKSYISGLDFLVAGRMHACIAAVSAGVPVVPIAYSRKFSGLFSMLGYDWILPVQGFDDRQALDYLDDCLAKREILERDTLAATAKVEALLGNYREVLAGVLAPFGRGRS